MPLPRHLGDRRLLLASLTGSERRGRLHPERPASCRRPSSRRTLSPARIPDWEREEGTLRPWRPASCRRLVTLLSPNAPDGGDSSTRQASSSTTHSVTGPTPSASMMVNPANAISVCRPMDGSLCSSVYFYLPLRINTLHIISVILLVGPHVNSSVSRVTSLMSTVAPGLMAAKSLSQFLFSYLPVFYNACART